MTGIDDPAVLDETARFREIASLLARGFVRLQAGMVPDRAQAESTKSGANKIAANRENSLELPGHQSPDDAHG